MNMVASPIELLCIGCPRGCPLTVEVTDDHSLRVRGHACRRGYAHANAEVNDPRRTITTTVRVRGGASPLVPVRSLAPIPKDKIAQALREVSGVTLDAPVTKGQIVLSSVAGTGIAVVTTRSVECERVAKEPRQTAEKHALSFCALPQ